MPFVRCHCITRESSIKQHTSISCVKFSWTSLQVARTHFSDVAEKALSGYLERPLLDAFKMGNRCFLLPYFVPVAIAPEAFEAVAIAPQAFGAAAAAVVEEVEEAAEEVGAEIPELHTTTID